MKKNEVITMAVSISKAAEMLDVSENLVRRAVKQRIINSVRFGPKRILIPIAEIEKILIINEQMSQNNDNYR